MLSWDTTGISTEWWMEYIITHNCCECANFTTVCSYTKTKWAPPIPDHWWCIPQAAVDWIWMDANHMLTRVTKQLSIFWLPHCTPLFTYIMMLQSQNLNTISRTRVAALRTLFHGFKKGTLRSYVCIYIWVLPLPAASSSTHSTLARCYMYPTAAVSTA